jgi:hypothetical protein
MGNISGKDVGCPDSVRVGHQAMGNSLVSPDRIRDLFKRCWPCDGVARGTQGQRAASGRRRPELMPNRSIGHSMKRSLVCLAALRTHGRHTFAILATRLRGLTARCLMKGTTPMRRIKRSNGLPGSIATNQRPSEKPQALPSKFYLSTLAI